MTINNLAIHHNNRLTGQNSIAAMCLDSLAKGGINEDGHYRISSKRTLEWFDLEGKPLNDAEFLELVGIGFRAAERLYYRYKKDCKKIIKNHGKSNKRVRTGIKYYDRKGQQAKQADLMKRESISHQKLVEFFKDNDYQTAYKLLDEYKAAKRANK